MDRSLKKVLLVGIIVAMLIFPGTPNVMAESLPAYQIQFLGNGSVVAINNSNTVIGVQTNATTGVQTALVSADGGAWAILPAPSGASSVFPTDINDAGVIIGVASMSSGRRAIRWTPIATGYTVDILPLLPGELASYATGINNSGQIVGARAGILGTPYGFGWMYTDADGIVDLNARYGWFATPADISDNGVILAGTQTFALSTQTVTDVGLTGPSNYYAIEGVDINNAGQIVGYASLRSSSLNIISVYRYLPGTGWEFISGTSKYTMANDINNLGDVCWSEQGAGIYFEGIGKYALGSLLEPATAAAGWIVTGYGCVLNDQRVVSTAGRNSITGETGAILLKPAGALPPPAAPTNLTATPHPATSSEPYVSINLSWTNGDPLLTRTYELERSISGQAAWTPVALVPPAMSTFHQDTTVALATAYDYRVRAIGVGGASQWSNIATATSPSTWDRTPPTVSILTPANGATVSGTVTVSAQATDNVAVKYLEISFWNQYLGQKIILGSVDNAGSLSVNWNTSGLTPAAYIVSAYAYDAIGNWKQTDITVNVAAAVKTLRSTAIGLSGSVVNGTANIVGYVTIRDANGKALSNVKVTAEWTLPDGSVKRLTAYTDSLGRARFTVSGVRGTYKLTVINATKTGYTFDKASSILTKSITK